MNDDEYRHRQIRDDWRKRENEEQRQRFNTLLAFVVFVAVFCVLIALAVRK